ncbi:MAG: flagellar hook-length control protein FliK [Acetivibrio ethanolgignens]
MAINHTPLTSGASSSQKSASQTASRSIGSMSNPGRTTPARALSIGQTIRGEVTDLRNHQATITMEDGTQVTARLENASQLSIGDIASFEVQDMNSSSIILKLLPMSKGLVAGNAIMKALEEAGLPRNEKNIAIVRQLIDHQMPINKQSIQLLLRQSYQFKDADLGTLVLMNRHHIPVTEGNVSQFQAYQNHEHPMLTKIADMAQEIPALLSELTKENPGEVLALFGKELLSILPQKVSAYGHSPALPIDFLSPEEREALASLFPEETLPEEAREMLLKGSASTRAVLSLLPEEAQTHPLAALLSEHLADYQSETGQLISLLTPEQLSDFRDLTKDFSLPLPLKSQIASGEASAGEVLAAIRDALSSLSGQQVTKLFQAPSFQELLQQNILSGWTLSTKDLVKEKSIERLYESIQKDFAALERLLKGALPDSEAAASESAKAQNLQQNMYFMNVLNQFFPYVQLPLQLKEQLTHGDLYVFTKKKDLAKKKDSLSVLLHLDMEQLGPLDIHLSMNRSEISSTFYVEDRSVERLLKTNIEELTKALSEKGYQLTSSFSIRERSLDIIKDFIEKDGAPAGMKRYSFDIRA